MDLNHPKHGFTAKPCLVGFGIRRNIVASAASLVNVANPSYLSFPSGIRHFESSQASKVSRRNPPWWDSQSRMPGTALEGAWIKASDCLGLYLHPGWPLKRPFLFRHACLFFQALHSTHEKQQQHASLKLGPPALHNFNSLRKAVSTRWKPYWGTLRILKNLQKTMFSNLFSMSSQPKCIRLQQPVSWAFSLYTSFRHMRSRRFSRAWRPFGRPASLYHGFSILPENHPSLCIPVWGCIPASVKMLPRLLATTYHY